MTGIRLNSLLLKVMFRVIRFPASVFFPFLLLRVFLFQVTGQQESGENACRDADYGRSGGNDHFEYRVQRRIGSRGGGKGEGITVIAAPLQLLTTRKLPPPRFSEMTTAVPVLSSSSARR